MFKYILGNNSVCEFINALMTSDIAENELKPTKKIS